jgi:signal transduction histidine kinase
MSATSFRAADLGLPALGAAQAESTGSAEVRRRRLPRPWALTADISLAVVAVVTLGLMAMQPQWATVPYHLLFLSVMLVYGFRVWPLLITALVIAAITSATGWLIVNDYRTGGVETPELAEIPLMPALLVAMVWHARRRVAANDALVRMTAVQRTMIERERTFFRDTSHAIRTPVTIARGHLELASDAGVDPEVRADMEVALRQLDRMSLLSNRLLALAQLDAGQTPPAEQLDLAAFVLELGDNWSVRSRRNWIVSCPESAIMHADPVWLALAVDALVENAVHFTVDGGTISVTGEVGRDVCTIRVADDGEGIDAEDLERVFQRFWHRKPPSGPMGSGLGLAMARATARAWGGDVVARQAAGGGACFELSLPRRAPRAGTTA